MRYSIYTLAHPINGQIFYVGKTVDLKTRFKQHLNLQHADNQFKNQIIEFILQNSAMPIIEELDYVDCVYREDEDYVHELEMYWIHQMRAWGFELCNKEGITAKTKYKRRYEHILKEGLVDKIKAYMTKKSNELKELKRRIHEDDRLDEQDKNMLLAGCKESWNIIMGRLNKYFDLDIELIPLTEEDQRLIALEAQLYPSKH